MREGRLLFPPEKIQAVIDAERAIDEIVRQRKLQTPEHSQVARRFHEAVEAAWPDEFWAALEPPHDDPDKLDVLLRFLEEDPHFFRTGYAKEKACGRIGKFSLDAEARRRIAAIVVQAVDRPAGREFSRQCGLARLADRSVLVPALIRKLDANDPAIAWRAYVAARGMLGLSRAIGHRTTLTPWYDERLRRYIEASDAAQRTRNHADMQEMRKHLRALPENPQ